jgi:hypothetical protein
MYLHIEIEGDPEGIVKINPTRLFIDTNTL